MIEFSDDLIIHGIAGDVGSETVDAKLEKGMEWNLNYNYAANDLAYFTLISRKEPLCHEFFLRSIMGPNFGSYIV